MAEGEGEAGPRLTRLRRLARAMRRDSAKQTVLLGLGYIALPSFYFVLLLLAGGPISWGPFTIAVGFTVLGFVMVVDGVRRLRSDRSRSE